jgi:hypothetical protein
VIGVVILIKKKKSNSSIKPGTSNQVVVATHSQTDLIAKTPVHIGRSIPDSEAAAALQTTTNVPDSYHSA